MPSRDEPLSTSRTAEPDNHPDQRQAREKLAHGLFEFLDEKKAQNILMLDLERVNPYFSIFLIATANSSVQLKSLVREITKKFHEELPPGGAGMRPDDVASGWVIVDFIDVIVHLFLKEQREFYNLERLWGDSNVMARSEEDQPHPYSS